MIRIVFCFCIVFCFNRFIEAQMLDAYLNYKNALMVIDDGISRQIDHVQPKFIYPGGTFIAYQTSNDGLKAYYKGKVNVLNHNKSDTVVNTRNLMVFVAANQLKIADKHGLKTLSGWVKSFIADDSLVVFSDDYSGLLKAYYKGSVQTLDNPLGTGINSAKTGSNIATFIDRNNHLRIFYRGELHTLDKLYKVSDFDCGQDIVSYYTESDGRFSVWFRGETFQISNFRPASFKSGSGIMAFESIDDKFSVFYDGRLIKIENFNPLSYQVVDSLVLYTTRSNLFRVFYKGQVYTLTDITPNVYQAAAGTIAWLDPLGRLKVFAGGVITTLSYERVKTFSLNGNVLQYTLGNYDTRFFYQGSKY
jgi:hypothetical protein